VHLLKGGRQLRRAGVPHVGLRQVITRLQVVAEQLRGLRA